MKLYYTLLATKDPVVLGLHQKNILLWRVDLPAQWVDLILKAIKKLQDNRK